MPTRASSRVDVELKYMYIYLYLYIYIYIYMYVESSRFVRERFAGSIAWRRAKR